MDQDSATRRTRFVVVTGVSGSGKSTALKAFEDLDYYAVDNLPVDLLPAMVQMPLGSDSRQVKVALGMDVRDPAFVDKFPGIYQKLIQDGWWLDLLYLDASDVTLVRRFSETRRQHPLSGPKDDVRKVITRERRLLSGIKEQASQVVDTSRFNGRDLKREIHKIFKEQAQPSPFHINLMSFGFKHGVPFEADLMMDVRFLLNPHYIEKLRDKTGLDPEVRNYVFSDPATHTFLNKYMDLLEFLLPRYANEGKSRLTIAIGCTGGHHRSVAVAEWLRKQLESIGHFVALRHRDMGL
jgi:UPF0042 nucleotide-binding protein